MKDFEGEPVFSGDWRAYLAKFKAQENCFLFTDENVLRIYGEEIKGFPHYAMPAGEENKTQETLFILLGRMAEAGILKDGTLLCMGGGVVLDLGGFAASIYMRGISHVFVPTTLLAQADACVGGKTGIDFAGVKNLIGSYAFPKEILLCPEFLKTLPGRELVCGLGEIIKCAALDGELFWTVFEHRAKLTDFEFLCEAVKRSLKFKQSVVERDRYEADVRRCLNLGHTTAHALEMSGNGLNHGESVLYGMYLESGISEELGGEREFLAKLRQLIRLAKGGMPPLALSEEILSPAKWDKKNLKGGRVRLVLVRRAGEYFECELPFERYCAAIEREMRALTEGEGAECGEEKGC